MLPPPSDFASLLTEQGGLEEQGRLNSDPHHRNHNNVTMSMEVGAGLEGGGGGRGIGRDGVGGGGGGERRRKMAGRKRREREKGDRERERERERERMEEGGVGWKEGGKERGDYKNGNCPSKQLMLPKQLLSQGENKVSRPSCSEHTSLVVDSDTA